MATPRKVRELSPSDAGYLAGLLDGEGTISMARRHAGGNRQLVVTIASTEIAILKHVRHVIGVGKITRKRTYKNNHAPGLCYAIANRQAIALLSQTHRYLQSYKRKRSALVLRHYVALTPRNGKYTPALTRAREKFVERFRRLQALRTTPG